MRLVLGNQALDVPKPEIEKLPSASKVIIAIDQDVCAASSRYIRMESQISCD
jgi:hypothetical protein